MEEYLSVLEAHGGKPLIRLPNEAKPTLIYSTAAEITKEELKALAGLTESYFIILYTS